ncbi:MAG TPA: IclR family transcriptional regulator [Ramlibacter sp.]|nr:IclR family transcriptional regulator [Ramlibacter sp.]
MSAGDGGQPPFAEQAAQTMAVLQAFTPVLQELGVAELAQQTGLPQAVVASIARTLCELGHLRLEPGSKRYRLGPALVTIARNFLGGRGVRAHARGHMEALATRFRAPVALTERDGTEMVYLEYVRGEAPVVVQHRVGTRLPLARSAAGRAWLAGAPAPLADVVRRQLAAQLHREWQQLEPRLDAAREDLRQLGFTRSYGDLQPEVNSAAVPFTSPVDGLLLVFSIAAPSMLAPAKRFDAELGPALVEMVGKVKAELEAGARP